MIIAFPAAAFCAAAEDDSGYRVAGVVTASKGNLAIIERPAGESMLVGVGDEIDEGQVVEIDDTTVRIRFPVDELLLPLSGEPGERLPLSQQAAATASQDKYGQKASDVYTSYGRVDLSGISYSKSGSTSNRSPNASTPASSTGASANTARAAMSGSVDVVTSEEKENEDTTVENSDQTNNAPAELARRLGPQTGLPAGLNVMDVNGQPVTSAVESQKQIEQMLAERKIVRLRVDGENAGGVVYIYPE